MDSVRPTILIVDDHPANIHLLAEALAGEYEIIVATNGQEAIELALAGDAPDLILLDILMPGMSGYEVCERLKKEEWTRSVPVIFVTAKNCRHRTFANGNRRLHRITTLAEQTRCITYRQAARCSKGGIFAKRMAFCHSTAAAQWHAKLGFKNPHRRH